LDVTQRILEELERIVKFYSDMLEDEYKNVEISEKLNADEKVLKKFGYLMAHKEVSLWFENYFPDDIDNSELYEFVIQKSSELKTFGKEFAAVSKSGKLNESYKSKLHWLGWIDGFKELISKCEVCLGGTSSSKGQNELD
jgi:hypothetical protein